MKIHLAEHYGMCFGVAAALRSIEKISESGPVTVLGELVHNPVVGERLSEKGVLHGDSNELGKTETESVVFTAHGVSERTRSQWAATDHTVFDTTCPLVKKAHLSLECLVLAGYLPVVIGRRDHTEVQGLIGDFPGALVVGEPDDLAFIPGDVTKIGVISQTTQPINHVESLVEEIREQFPAAEVRFVDTVCQPTKDRQSAMENLCRKCDTVVVVGGRNSNNTRQLVKAAELRGCDAVHVVSAGELETGRFRQSENIGVTAGTSTLDETVAEVVETLRRFSVLLA